ncbi:MAG TPA: class I SAM-dependent methyltransferase [Thermoanaerobaculia bacterium]|nr:class I SAM-dependent methyltransferase [Thermoanaerobaculia bacterium]
MRVLRRRWRDDLRDLRRYLMAAYIDLRLAVTGKADRELPPLRLRDVGGGDFRQVGDDLVKVLAEHGLKSTDRVLDIGCGVGRVAIPLTRYLSGGSYEGFDVVKSWVRWCRRHITSRHPSFRFTHASIYNSHYNRRGTPVETFRFPYPDQSFDFAFATSLFTHLSPAGAKNYLREAGRVLRPGGTLCATFFLTGTETFTALDFKVVRDEHRLLDGDDPDAAVAFTEAWLDEQLSRNVWQEPSMIAGSWRAGERAVMFQDLVVVKKRGA